MERPTTLGLLLTAFDLGFVLPFKRKMSRHALAPLPNEPRCTVALTAYNDEASIYDAVRDFLSRPDVRCVIVVSNNSSDRTMERAREAGAIVYNEALQGYGACVFRCLKEALAHDDTGLVVVCEGDRTFRASDLDGSQWKPCLWATFDCNGCDWLYFCRGPTSARPGVVSFRQGA